MRRDIIFDGRTYREPNTGRWYITVSASLLEEPETRYSTREYKLEGEEDFSAAEFRAMDRLTLYIATKKNWATLKGAREKWNT